jgi:hypothetical protein
MTLYIENAVNFPEVGSISLNGVWHPNAALLAVASFSQEKGGFVTIFDELVRVNELLVFHQSILTGRAIKRH